jgi:hypothetical protein
MASTGMARERWCKLLKTLSYFIGSCRVANKKFLAEPAVSAYLPMYFISPYNRNLGISNIIPNHLSVFVPGFGTALSILVQWQKSLPWSSTCWVRIPVQTALEFPMLVCVQVYDFVPRPKFCKYLHSPEFWNYMALSM